MKFCPDCGAKLVIEGSRFCQHCGKELSGGNDLRAGEPVLSSALLAGSAAPAVTVAVSTAPSSRGRLSPWFWLGSALLALALVSWWIPVLGGWPPAPYMAYTGLDIVLIMGFMNAYLFRRVGRQRLMGFAVGVIVGLALIWSMKIAIVGARHLGLLPAEGASQSGASLDIRPLIDPTGWTEESTGTAEAGPWLDHSPPGTRFYRDAKGIIYRLYPPGVRPQAEPANPFGLNDSTLERPGRLRREEAGDTAGRH